MIKKRPEWVTASPSRRFPLNLQPATSTSGFGLISSDVGFLVKILIGSTSC